MSSPAMPDTSHLKHGIVVHYHEIGLKGRNRGMFERILVDNLKRAFGEGVAVRVVSGRLIVPLDAPATDEMLATISRTYGVAGFSRALVVDSTMDAMMSAANSLMQGRDAATFAVAARRSSKEHTFTSKDINIAVGDHIRTTFGLGVNLSDPGVTVHIEVVGKTSYLYTDKIPGPGGLPVSVSGRVMVLLSGGIDSPVAAHRMMRRGAKTRLVHFHSAPFTDNSSPRKAQELAEMIADWQGTTRLYLIAFGNTQQQIVVEAPPSLRVILYRRFMVRIAAELAYKERAKALVTGDSLGQVASQTLENMICVEDASPMPILRPLIGDDKKDIISEATKLGTFETSIQPFADCCSMFVPKSPATRATIEECIRAEDKLPVREIVDECVANAELIVVRR